MFFTALSQCCEKLLVQDGDVVALFKEAPFEHEDGRSLGEPVEAQILYVETVY